MLSSEIVLVTFFLAHSAPTPPLLRPWDVQGEWVSECVEFYIDFPFATLLSSSSSSSSTWLAVVAGPDEDDDAVFQVERLQSERQKGSFVGSHTTMGRKDILA